MMTKKLTLQLALFGLNPADWVGALDGTLIVFICKSEPTLRLLGKTCRRTCKLSKLQIYWG